ncbi:MAG: glycosyltransferase [Candidatus Solibacter sp.]
MTSVSIVIPCRNEKGHVRLLLDGILSQDFGGLTWEALIADGMSRDGTREIVSEYMAREPRIRMVDNPGRIVSSGLNLAILAATGEIVVRMDAHTVYAPDYVRKCVFWLKKTEADCVGGPWQARGSTYTSRAIAAAFQSPLSAGGARSHNPSFEGFVDTVYLGCWRRSTLQALGGFDEDLVRNQDDELSLRIHLRGGKLWQTPDIVSWYCPRSSLRALLHQYYQYGFWKVAVIRKHRRPASWRHLVPGLFLMGLSGLLLAAIAGYTLGLTVIGWISLTVLATTLSLYTLALIGGAIFAGMRAGAALFPILLCIFPCFHFGYGLGFLHGMWYWRIRDGRPAPAKAATELTR